MVWKKSLQDLHLLFLVGLSAIDTVLPHYVSWSESWTWAEPHDAAWTENVAHNRRFLTQMSRESLRNNTEVRNRKLVGEESQQSRRTNGIRGQRQQQKGRDLQLDPSNTPLNVLVCLVQWSNHPTRNTAVPLESYEQLFNGEGRDASLYPGGTVKDYFNTISYGEFDINFSVTDWKMTDASEQTYTADGSQGRNQDILNAFETVLDALDDDFFDFGDFDSDFDRKIDFTVFLHSGYDGTTGGDDCETGKTSQERVASHAWSGADQSTWRSRAGLALGAYVVAPAFRGVCNTEIGRIGTIVHELIHPFGLPEMYDTEFFDTGNLGGIDRFGVMANPSGNSGGDLAWPGHVGAWSRTELGWIEPTVISSDGTYTLRPVEQFPEIFKITEGFADKEYLLIENRQPIQGDFDEKFFSPGGILIYHVDENIWDIFEDVVVKGNHPRGGPFQAGWPGNGRHYPVALLQADGLYELEQGINGGGSTDIWNDPSQVLGPGNGESVASSATYPNTDSYASGNIKTTGITIKNFKTGDDLVMTFQVCGLDDGDCADDVSIPTDSPDTEAPTKAPTPSPTTLSPTTLSPTTLSPTTPSPIDPGPTDPGPTDPDPTPVAPVAPVAPVSPPITTPTDSGPTDSGPTDPGPTDPSPTDPSPTPPIETNSPTRNPTKFPTKFPTKSPTKSPTLNPTMNPTTVAPTPLPTPMPTAKPTQLIFSTLILGPTPAEEKALFPTPAALKYIAGNILRPSVNTLPPNPAALSPAPTA